MASFSISDKKLVPIKEVEFKKERELQTLTEENLREIFGLQFVRTEFELKGLRIDTLAFNPETNSFVIIEYKKDRSFSVVDQGFSYLSLLHNNRANFILEFNKGLKKSVTDEDEIDWTQTKVLFLARSFTNYQINSTAFKRLPIELWEVTRYENETILYNQVKSQDAKYSIDAVIDDKEIKHVSKEIKEYSEVDLFPNGHKSTELYQVVKERFLEVDPTLVFKPTKQYIAVQKPGNWRNIAGINPYQAKLVVDFTRLQPKDFEDPEKKVFYKKNSMKYFNQHISSFTVDSEKDVGYLIPLFQQARTKFIDQFGG